MREIAVVAILILLCGSIYSIVLYKDKENAKNEKAYTNEIKTLQVKVNNAEVEKKETKAKEAFITVEKEIIKESNITRSYTKKMMEDKDVKNFTDSF